jgi:hypothetical protein
MSLAGLRGSLRSRSSNHRSRSSGNRNDLTGPNFPEPLRRDIYIFFSVLVRMVRIRPVMHVSMLVNDSVMMCMDVRMLRRTHDVAVGLVRCILILCCRHESIDFNTRSSRGLASSSCQTGAGGTVIMNRL